MASSHRWSTPCSAIRSAMARLTTSRGASSSTKRSPSASRSSAPWPAQRLGQQGPGHGRVVQRRRVELEELDVGHRHPGPQGHGDAVAGGLERVGRDRVELARAAGGQHHLAGPDLAAVPSGSRAPPRAQRPPSTIRSRANHCSRTAAAVPRAADDERPLDLGAGGGPAGVQDAGGGVPAFAGQGQIARPPRGRTRAQRDQLATRPGPSSTSTRTASTSHRPAPAARVSARWRSVESSSPPSDGGHAALGPAGGRLRQLGLGQDADPQPGVPRPAGRRPTARPRRCRGRGRRAPRVAPPDAGRAPASAGDGRAQLGVERRRR